MLCAVAKVPIVPLLAMIAQIWLDPRTNTLAQLFCGNSGIVFSGKLALALTRFFIAAERFNHALIIATRR